MGRRNVKNYLEFILVENIKGPYFPLVDNVLLYSLKIMMHHHLTIKCF